MTLLTPKGGGFTALFGKRALAVKLLYHQKDLHAFTLKNLKISGDLQATLRRLIGVAFENKAFTDLITLNAISNFVAKYFVLLYGLKYKYIFSL